MTNRVRAWYLMCCKNKKYKPTVKGLVEYWNTYKYILEPVYYYSGRQWSCYGNDNLKNNDVILSLPY